MGQGSEGSTGSTIARWTQYSVSGSQDSNGIRHIASSGHGELEALARPMAPVLDSRHTPGMEGIVFIYSPYVRSFIQHTCDKDFVKCQGHRKEQMGPAVVRS